MIFIVFDLIGLAGAIFLIKRQIAFIPIGAVVSALVIILLVTCRIVWGNFSYKKL